MCAAGSQWGVGSALTQVPCEQSPPLKLRGSFISEQGAREVRRPRRGLVGGRGSSQELSREVVRPGTPGCSLRQSWDPGGRNTERPKVFLSVKVWLSL